MSMPVHRQAFLWMSAIIAVGGLSLLGVAISAARAGVWSAAGFIGLLGVALIATMVLGLTRYRYSPRPRSPDA